MIVHTSSEYDINQEGFCGQQNPEAIPFRTAQSKSPKVLYLVLSNSTETERKMRQAIRISWSNNDENKTLSDNHKVLFFLGQTEETDEYNQYDSDLQMYKDVKFREEGLAHQDIIRTDVSEADVQYNLKQTIAMLSWTYKYCQLARFVVRTTSSTYVNVKVLETFAEQEMFAANRIYGSILKRMLPDRNRDGIHYISKEEWPWDFFPPFLKEPSFVLSSDVIPRLLLGMV